VCGHHCDLKVYQENVKYDLSVSIKPRFPWRHCVGERIVACVPPVVTGRGMWTLVKPLC
jgi:hypothetical protein